MKDEIWKIVYYATADGKLPFRDWFESLSDLQAQDVISARLTRLRHGNFGKCEPVGLGISELKINYGPGYRVYFGRVGGRIVLLLCGGDKSTQQKDIYKARGYWQFYKEKRK
jgi:putative addiction module killer protein